MNTCVTLPRPIAVISADDYTLKITFNNDETRLFNVTPYLVYPAFATLQLLSVQMTVYFRISKRYCTKLKVCRAPSYGLISPSNPFTNAKGVGGQPAMTISTGITLDTAPQLA